jgi:polysaccharide pyruvyl transferase WcaK-like protein
MWYTKAELVGSRTVLVQFASGNGGNKIYVVPALQMVVAIAPALMVNIMGSGGRRRFC